MAQSDYAQGALFVNGSPENQLSSLEITWNSGQQRVDVMNEGLGGFTPGSGDVEVKVGFLMPKNGPTFDYAGFCARGEYVTLQVWFGPLSYSGKGKFLTTSMSQATNANSEGTANWTGELKEPEE